MVIDQLPKWRLYTNLPRLKRAFELLDAPDAAKWPEGRVDLENDLIFAMPQSYLTKPASDGKWEAHRRYIDIQYIVYGAEKMGWAPITNLVPTGTFDETKDVRFYTGTGDYITVREGMFAIFYPQDAHMPCLRVSRQAQQVRKIVVKVAVD